MREYLMSVIGAALIAGVISTIVPAGNGEGLKKYVNLIGALCVLCVLLAPVGGVLEYIGGAAEQNFEGWLEGGGDYDRRYRELLLSVGKENIESGIKALLGERFGIPEGECRVTASVREKDGELELLGIEITLSGRSVLKDPYAIEKYISDLLDCGCSVS